MSVLSKTAIATKAIGKGAKFGAKNFGTGLAVVGGISTFNYNREKGDGVLTAGAKAGIDFAMGEMLGGWGQLAYGTAMVAPKAIIKGGQQLERMSRDMQKQSIPTLFGNASFNDTQGTYTMRQAGMKLAQASKYNLQQTLMGNEAQYLHY